MTVRGRAQAGAGAFSTVKGAAAPSLVPANAGGGYGSHMLPPAPGGTRDTHPREPAGFEPADAAQNEPEAGA